jgi:hypothetical protein
MKENQLGYEWDPNAPGPPWYTGNTFVGDPGLAGPAGGACIYVNDDVHDILHMNVDGNWKFVGLHQSTPDSLVVYPSTDFLLR